MQKDSNFYKRAINEYNVYKDDLEKSFSIVKNFIARNKLVLVGGMAIDLSLRKFGSQLYSGDELPDYDFISPTFHIHAYELAFELKKAGIEEIQVINAMHPSTMKVRIHLNVVADITYIPSEIFNRLPTIPYQGILLIHPHYQVIDQHIALSNPYVNPPLETILGGRWKKDITRHDLITSVFPFPHNLDVESKYAKHLTEENVKNIKKYLKSPAPITKYTLSIGLFNKECIGGFAAIAYWYERAKKLGFEFNKDSPQLKLGFEIQKKNIIISIPKYITIYSEDYERLLKIIQKTVVSKKETPHYFNSILEKTLRKVILAEYEIFDSYGRLISAHYDEELSCHVVNLQTVQVHMLTEWVVNQSVIHLIGYILSRELVSYAAKQELKKPFLEFLPSPLIYGTENVSHTNIIARRKYISVLDKKPLERGIPKALYEENFGDDAYIKKIYTFDPATSQEYPFDGKEVEEFEKYTMPESILAK